MTWGRTGPDRMVEKWGSPSGRRGLITERPRGPSICQNQTGVL